MFNKLDIFKINDSEFYHMNELNQSELNSITQRNNHELAFYCILVQ